MKRNHTVELLKKVQRVDAPPYLYTRIQARIQARQAEQMPAAGAWAWSLAFGLLLAVNVLALQRSSQTSSSESLARYLNLNQTIQLYADEK